MPALRLTGLLAAAMGCALLLGCSNPRRKAERVLRESDVPHLRMEAARLYKDIFAARGAAFFPVPDTSWPSSFIVFAPARVNAYPDGFALVLDPEADQEAGLYVVPEGIEHHPGASSRATFTPLAPGVYWFQFGGSK